MKAFLMRRDLDFDSDAGLPPHAVPRSRLMQLFGLSSGRRSA